MDISCQGYPCKHREEERTDGVLVGNPRMVVRRNRLQEVMVGRGRVG